MPLLLKTEFELAQVFIWKNETNFSRLEHQYRNQFSTLDYHDFHPHRKMEFVNSRALIFSLFPAFHSQKNEHGAFLPHCNWHLSLSHTPTFSSLALSLSPIGIDTEQIHARVSKIWPRFTTPREKTQFHDVHDQTLVWSAKEAAFKKRQSGLHLQSDIEVLSPFVGQKGKMKIRVHNEMEWIHYFKLHDHVVCLSV